VILTIFFWKDNPIGIVALMVLCGGDGLADIVGKRFGGNSKLSWSQKKSWAGSFGMFVGGWAFSVVVLGIYVAAGYFTGTISHYLIGITVIAVAATLVESLPFDDIDNITVTLVAVLLGYWVL
jgi:phytol kinase